jgi:hypothetical protein
MFDSPKRDKADQQAPDGTRVDDDGLRWYPPAGNGILAAAQGYFPRKGSVTPGDVTTNAEEGIKISGPDEGEPVPGVESRKTSIKSKSEKDIAARRLSGAIYGYADIQQMATPQLPRFQHKVTATL